MLIYLMGVAGLVVWIVLWAMGMKSFDAMLVFLAFLLVAAGLHLVLPYLPGNRQKTDDSGGSWTPR